MLERLVPTSVEVRHAAEVVGDPRLAGKVADLDVQVIRLQAVGLGFWITPEERCNGEYSIRAGECTQFIAPLRLLRRKPGQFHGLGEALLAQAHERSECR